VAGNERDGDDLFEDLDKFFAPIKDVEWEEPASAGARETPSEEHVSVRADEPGPPAAPAPPSTEVVAEGPTEEPLEGDEIDDEDWYDTTVLETIEGIGVDEEIDDEIDGGADDAAGAAGPAPDETDQIVEVGDLVGDDAEVDSATQPDPAQAGLFEPTGDDVGASQQDTGWEVADDDDQGYADAVIVGGTDDPDIETAPIATIDELMGGVEPPGGIDEPFESPAASGTMLGELAPDEVEHDILADLSETEPQHEPVLVGTEGLGGPSWQEPGALEVDRRGPAPDERDVPAAFMTGGILAIAAIASLLIGDWLFGLLAGAVVLVAQGELFGVMVKHHRQPATAVGLIAGGLMLAAAYFRGESAVLAMFALGVAATFLWFISGPSANRKDVAANIGLTVLNMAWVPLLGSYLLVLLEGDSGVSLVLSVIGLTFVFDTAAFLSGSVWGGQFFERPLAPTVSPNKSVEGVIVGTLVTVVVAVTLVTSFVEPFEQLRVEALLLGIVVAAAATFGDLAESLIKRDLGIKDMGSILPGHGGVLDRIDSVLFVAPAAFFLYRVIIV
jgi:phosphatidate cytidylyltransferase